MSINAAIANGLPWCVAGGYAACPQLATDMDVWVLAGTGDGYHPVGLEALAGGICRAIPSIIPAEEDTAETPAYILDRGVRIRKVGTLGIRHIMAAEVDTIQELLGCFDISTHQCALDEDGNFVKGRAWTPITQLPVKLFNTPNTDVRMDKIRARYLPHRFTAPWEAIA